MGSDVNQKYGVFLNKMIQGISEVYKRRELLGNLIVRNLKIRYKGSVLGFFWSLLDPLFMMLVYYIFIKLMRFSINLPYLLLGIMLWQYLLLTVNDSLGAISGNANLLKKVYFPRLVLPVATVIANLINFLLSLFVLAIFFIFAGVQIQWQMIWMIPFLIGLQFIFCLGLSLFISSVAVYFKDTHHLVGVILMAWFFLTPIIYPVSLVPDKYLFLYFLNPMASIMCIFRNIVLSLGYPQVPVISISLALPLFILIIGWWIFYKLEPNFADEL